MPVLSPPIPPPRPPTCSLPRLFFVPHTLSTSLNCSSFPPPLLALPLLFPSFHTLPHYPIP